MSQVTIVPGTRADPVITILVVKVDIHDPNPDQWVRLRLSVESKAIKDALHQSTYRGCFKVEFLESARPQDLIQDVTRYKPQILHFSGHGDRRRRAMLSRRRWPEEDCHAAESGQGVSAGI